MHAFSHLPAVSTMQVLTLPDTHDMSPDLSICCCTGMLLPEALPITLCIPVDVDAEAAPLYGLYRRVF
jgi:hypothetical protein